MIELEFEQKEALSQLTQWCKEGRKFNTCAGTAGTGKTEILSRLSQTFPRFGCGSFTGKAVQVLRDRGIDHASTIHSMIYRPNETEDEDGNIITEFIPKKRIEVQNEFDGFILDEGSMISLDMIKTLKSFRLPIVVFGDHGQIPAIGTEADLMVNPDIKLEKIHRNAGEIAFFAKFLREGNAAQDFNCETKVKVISKKEVTDEMLVNTDQVIVSFNKYRINLNNKIRKLFGREGDPQKDDRIICLRNNKQIGIFNGMQGKIKNIDHKKKKLIFETDYLICKVKYMPTQFMMEKTTEDYDPDINLFDYAYSITCHKSQGSQFDNLVVFEQFCQHWDMARFNYTASSRAKKSLIWIV